MNTDRTQTRGRPRTLGYERCDRCGRDSNKTAAIWPDGRICGICFYNATHTYGICPRCNTNRMLPVERFAKWHHLRHIRKIAIDGVSSQAAVHNAKQEITEALKFVLWLTSERHHSLRTCSQADIDLWLATGPTTRSVIRTFIVFASKERLSPALSVPHRQAKTSRSITREERLTWITRCLDEEPGTLPVRAAALLLLLYAQPLIRVATLPLTAIDDDDAMHVRFDTIRVFVPDPFASILREHLTNRAPARTRTIDTNPWLFPGGRAGEHITHTYLKNRIQKLGINLLGTRNRAFNDLVMAMPAPIVADTLGYSYQVTALHAAQTGVTFARYVAPTAEEKSERSGPPR